MSQLKLTADGGGGTVSLKGPSSTTGNAAIELTVPGTGSSTLATTATAGKILQVQQKYFDSTASFSVSQSTTPYDYTSGDNLVVAITPTSSSSKILVSGHITVSMSGNNVFFLALRRSIGGGSLATIGANASPSNRFNAIAQVRQSNGNDGVPISISFLDSPSTTSEVKYSYGFMHSAGGSSRTIYINRTHSDSDQSDYGYTGATILAQEVAA